MSKNAIPIPSQTYLREAFDYNAETGTLTWKERPREHFATESRWKYHRTSYAGKVAGSEWACGSGRCNSKYRRVTLTVDDKVCYFAAHRIIWVLMNGSIPENHEVDHVDVDGLNNRWSNLRLATPSQNMCNTRLMRNNTTGYRGVSKYRKGFQAYINANGKRISLGNFETAELANIARVQAAKEHHGQFYRAQ